MRPATRTFADGGRILRYIIEAVDLTKRFGNFIAVKGISFHLVQGECLGLLGPNGAGKTSTIRMTYASSPMTSGSLNVFGLDIRTQWRSIKSRIGVCQQENNLDPDLTVWQNLEVFGRYFALSKKQSCQKAEQLLQFIALEHRKDAPVTDLSGGMMRRLVIARALLNDPDLLILDEPTTGLDPQSRHQVWERLDELRSRGLSILMTTHYMDEAAHLCDRLIIMDHGEILVEGKPERLIQKYAGDRVIEIAQPTDALRRFIHKRRLEHDDLGRRLIVYGQESNPYFQMIRDQYCKENCRIRMSTLEDVFLRLTGRELRE